jgi:kumamolisin
MESWSDQGKRGMNLAFKKAALKGISVFAASGDDGAIDAAPSKTFQVDYPATDPYVTGTGGTRLTINNGQLGSEVAWNNGKGRGSGGGGISPDEVPDYQKGVQMPPNANNTGVLGRGVPDVAGNADPVTGYKIRVGGSETVMGGTSAVAPLYAALAVRLNEGLGDGKQVGFMNPFLYKNGLAGTAPFFNDVTSGNNNGYNTGPGWDAVTGWGSLNGEKLLAAYKADSGSLATRIMNLVPGEMKSTRDIIPIPMNVKVPTFDQVKAQIKSA